MSLSQISSLPLLDRLDDCTSFVYLEGLLLLHVNSNKEIDVRPRPLSEEFVPCVPSACTMIWSAWTHGGINT